VKPLHRTFALLAVVALAVAGCSGSKTDPTTVPTSGVDGTPAPSVVFEPGHFAYDFAGVKATFVMVGHTATLTVHNGAGTQLGPPRIVVIDQKDQHVQGTITGAKPIADGGNATFTITFPDAIDQTTVGLIQISFGDVSYGLLKPA
jgi:hypothetical protein